MTTDAEVREKLTERFREAAVASDASTLMILAADEWLQTALDSLSQPETEPRDQVRLEDLLSDEVLCAFEMHGRTLSMAPPGAVELDQLRERMRAVWNQATDQEEEP